MSQIQVDLDSVRDLDARQIADDIQRHLKQTSGVPLTEATAGDFWQALSLVVRDIKS